MSPLRDTREVPCQKSRAKKSLLTRSTRRPLLVSPLDPRRELVRIPATHGIQRNTRWDGTVGVFQANAEDSHSLALAFRNLPFHPLTLGGSIPDENHAHGGGFDVL